MLGINKNKISIIIRAYNAEATIEKALKSILGQDNFKSDCELLVINDGSKDKTSQIVGSYRQDPKIKIIDQENKGAIVSANKGFQKAVGEWIMILDADDYLVPNALDLVLNNLKNNIGYDVYYFDYFEGWGDKFKLVSPKSVFESLAGGMVINRQKLIDIGYWDENFTFPEYDMILKTWKNWKILYVPTPLFYYCRSLNSLSANPEAFKNSINLLKSAYPDKLDLIKQIRTY